MLKRLPKWTGVVANPDVDRDAGESEADQSDEGVGAATAAETSRSGSATRKAKQKDEERPIGRKAAKRARTEEEAIKSAMRESSQALRTIAASIEKRTAIGQAAQELQAQQAAADFFSRPVVRDREEAASFQELLRTEMLEQGRALFAAAKARRAAALRGSARSQGSAVEPGASTEGPAAGIGGVGQRAADRARGVNSMATKVRAARAALRDADIDLTTSSTTTGRNDDAVAEVRACDAAAEKDGGAGAASGDAAPCGTDATARMTEESDAVEEVA